MVCAIAAAVALLVVPTGSSRSVSVDRSGGRTSDITHHTLLQSEGRSILLVLAVPIILTVIPPLTSLRQRRTATLICTSLLSVGVVLALMSIGVFFVPAVVCALVARSEARADGNWRTFEDEPRLDPITKAAKTQRCGSSAASGRPAVIWASPRTPWRA